MIGTNSGTHCTRLDEHPRPGRRFTSHYLSTKYFLTAYSGNGPVDLLQIYRTSVDAHSMHITWAPTGADKRAEILPAHQTFLTPIA